MKGMEVDYYNWCGGRREARLIDITREEWIQWWKDTGVYDQRGPHAGCVTMHRIDTTMPFSLSNIELRTLKAPKRNYMSDNKKAPKITVETINNELEIQKKLTAEWKELAFDLMQRYMDQSERDQLLMDTLTTYVGKKVRAK